MLQKRLKRAGATSVPLPDEGVTSALFTASYWLPSAATSCKGLANSHITAAGGWSRMYRMRRLLLKAEWLLVDEPEERDLFLAALFLFMSWFALAIPLLDLYEGESGLDGLVPLALVPMFLAWAALYALPTHGRRILLWLRLVHALSLIGGLALFVYSVAVNARNVWEPVVFAAVTVLLLFLVLLFRYRRRRGRRYY